MTKVRVLIGTRKGAFLASSDGSRKGWKVEGPHFAGWEVYHLKGSPADPDRLYASQSSGWFGQVMQRSNDGGKTWEAVGNQFAYEGEVGTHAWYDGSPHPYEFKRVWHLEPSLDDPDTVFAGVEDAAIFKTTDGGKTWGELPSLRTQKSSPGWAPGAGGLCLHTILIDPSNHDTMYGAISAAGVFKTNDAGKSWRPTNRGLRSNTMPDQDAEVGHCVHRLAMHPSRPNVLFMQKHWDVMRTDDGGESWHEISGDLPTDFGFVIDVNTNEPDTVYVVPITSDSLHFVPDGKLRVYRSKTGGNEWEALTKGLPQKNVYVNVLRDAMAVDALDPCGVYFGTSGGQVYASANAGDSWDPIVRDLPPVVSVEVQTLA
ncbi:MAG TPA: sialidase family protein [Candidatus Eisenbacteria bacterium]|nr:sialidase family protein [Candidatus Eisenbacteria bacterium]